VQTDDKANKATKASAQAAEASRRRATEDLLKLADGYGISIADARSIIAEALATKHGSPSKRQRG